MAAYIAPVPPAPISASSLAAAVPPDVVAPLARDGFVLVRGERMRTLLEAAGARDWASFADSWNDLGVDMYMADGGRYRRRRFSTFAASDSAPGCEPGERCITRKPHQPHYQSRDYNLLNGGVARWFLPIADLVIDHPVLRAVLETTHRWFDELTPAEARPRVWHVEVHQFRIETGPEQGLATPEGMHRDGVDWVLVMLVRRENIASGETQLEDTAHRPLGSFTLTEPMDSTLVDDDRVFHGVTPLEQHDPSRPAYRDVLVVTFRRE
jgi:hypothetical protein